MWDLEVLQGVLRTENHFTRQPFDCENAADTFKKELTKEIAVVRLCGIIFSSKILGSLDTYLTREMEDFEYVSRAVAM